MPSNSGVTKWHGGAALDVPAAQPGSGGPCWLPASAMDATEPQPQRAPSVCSRWKAKAPMRRMRPPRANEQGLQSG
jgi:hypothetical protein